MIAKVKDILTEQYLCLNCLGRQFALLTSGTTNRARGESLLLTLAMEIHKEFLENNVIPDNINVFNTKFPPLKSLVDKLKIQNINPQEQLCYICNNILEDHNLNAIASKIQAHANNYEFSTFLVGCNVPPRISEKEEILRAKFNLQFGEPLKSEFNRELGKKTGALLPDKEVEFNNPEILFIVDLDSRFISVKSNPLFIEGRYRKLVRGIPQSKWHCRECRGKGCDKCNHTGRLYQDSVEEYITPYVLQVAKGTDSKLHCAGREDIDALMLGNGRPFVVEVKQPKIRNLNLIDLENKINTSSNRRIDVVLSGISNRMTIRQLKGESSQVAKRYRMKIQTQKEVNWDIERIKNELVCKIMQKTPKRVLHRRADLTREKKVHSIELNIISSNQAEIEVFCQGGLYVKELIHGDEGRTMPSLAQILETEIKVLYLDVLEVKGLQLEIKSE